MLRRKRAPSGVDASPLQHPSSNFSVRFNVKADKSSEFVDITQEALPDDSPTPPNSLEKGPIPPPRRIFSPIDTTSSSQPAPDQPSAFGIANSPVVDRVSSFRDNLHSFRERFSHRKNSDVEEKDKPVVQSPGDHPPTLLGKLQKKIEDRRVYGSHKETHSGATSPTKDHDVSGHLSKSTCSGSYNLHGSTESLPRCLDSKIQPAVVEVTSKKSELRKSESLYNIVSGKKELLPSRAGQSPPYDAESRILNKSYAPELGDTFATAPTDYKGSYRDSSDFDALHGGFSSLPPLMVVIGLLVAVVVTPMPSFMSGLLFGCIVTAAASVRIWFTFLFPRKPKEKYGTPPVPPALVNGDALSRFSAPHLAEPPSTWMNQLVGEFDTASFHINQTQSVYVSLDGVDLRIRKPKTRIVPRRAMFDEEMDSETFTFSESRIYKLTGADISLMPPDIPRKRRWLWRFPIAIKLSDAQSIEHLMEEIRQKATKQDEKEEKKKDKEKELPRETLPVRASSTLYILPRSDREKEDWYWRLVAAAGKISFPTMRPNLSPNLSTLNVLFHRVFYDVLTEFAWKEVIHKKIQKKLSIIRLPYYIEEIQITDMDLGKHLPIISNVSEKPKIDQRGIWIEMDFEYHGTVLMTLATKLNLMRLKKDKDDPEGKQGEQKSDVQMDSISVNSLESAATTFTSSSSREKERNPNLYESDESDEFDETSPAPDGGKQKMIRFVEKITESKAFQKLTEVGVVRRAMENVSETDLCLTVVVERLAGRLAINVPHPPSDKIWYGFVQKPDLHLKAFPKLGEREVTFNQVTDWIEKKMTSEFHRLITVPNMDDLTVPVMNSALDDPEFRLAKLCDLILK